MQYYSDEIGQKQPKLIDYFTNGILKPDKNISHCLLFWGADTKTQCELALEVARLLNCEKDGAKDCTCLNCKWIKETNFDEENSQTIKTHPAVKIYTRLDYKDDTATDETDSTTGKKNISITQAKNIINELSITSDYHRVYIFCDRDEDGNLLPLNKLNFPEATSNALLKTFEEPPQNTTFIFLTKDRSDIISTVVSRSQSFFVPSVVEELSYYTNVENVISNYWTIPQNQVIDFENKLYNLANENEPKEILTQMQNYIIDVIKSNSENKRLFYKLKRDLEHIETAKRQISLAKPMNLQTVIENLCFKLIMQ